MMSPQIMATTGHPPRTNAPVDGEKPDAPPVPAADPDMASLASASVIRWRVPAASFAAGLLLGWIAHAAVAPAPPVDLPRGPVTEHQTGPAAGRFAPMRLASALVAGLLAGGAAAIALRPSDRRSTNRQRLAARAASTPLGSPPATEEGHNERGGPGRPGGEAMAPHSDARRAAEATAQLPAVDDTHAEGRWATDSVTLGQTVSAQFHGPNPRYYRTWLVYDGGGALVAGFGMRAFRDGPVEAVEVWFFEREAEGEEVPRVALAAPAAATRPELVAHFGDAGVPVLPAIAGRTARLKTTSHHLTLSVARATVDDSALGLLSLTIDFLPASGR